MDENGSTGVAVTDASSNDSEERVSFATLRFGEITVARSRILEFPRGMVGMPQGRRFVFLHLEDEPGPFFWLQSVDDPALAFVVCEPQRFFPHYHIPLSREDQSTLHLSDQQDGLVCVILVVPEDPRHITANLRGPLIINTVARLGMQLVLAGDDYPVRAPLFHSETPSAGQTFASGTEGAKQCSF
ncbi:MAG: flagellar assembly protein FliW [Planctomycetota bacterium]